MSLNDSHAMVTGVTGFVGRSLLRKTPVVLPRLSNECALRPLNGVTAEERMVRLLGKSVFGPLRHEFGDAGFESMVHPAGQRHRRRSDRYARDTK